jgi:hypothetical protein
MKLTIDENGMLTLHDIPALTFEAVWYLLYLGSQTARHIDAAKATMGYKCNAGGVCVACQWQELMEPFNDIAQDYGRLVEPHLSSVRRHHGGMN